MYCQTHCDKCKKTISVREDRVSLKGGLRYCTVCFWDMIDKHHFTTDRDEEPEEKLKAIPPEKGE